ncbi:hypothetical protein EHS13_17900 [Paenibacillus psychroresistens]|uniref:Uncharacterized protein n=1 Tax=Paenibacillus psychroresistens TaxID=1778678 RepID=A0A6B8RMK9_9BACL|nr:hypothetical protein EHS13_17900 [Paenibacillus psychroresistens]
MLSIIIFLAICVVVAGVLAYRIHIATKTNNHNNNHKQ